MNFFSSAEYLERDLGIFIIFIGYVSLLYLVFTGRKINVPGPYFLLVGLGSALSAYNMVKRNRSMHVILMEASIALSALYVYFK